MFYNIDSFLIYWEKDNFIQQVSCWLVLKVIQTHLHIHITLPVLYEENKQHAHVTRDAIRIS